MSWPFAIMFVASVTYTVASIIRRLEGRPSGDPRGSRVRAGSAWHGKPQTTRMHAHPMTDRERLHAWQQAYRKGDPRW